MGVYLLECFSENLLREVIVFQAKTQFLINFLLTLLQFRVALSIVLRC